MLIRTYHCALVFETELLGIQGVEKPEKIVTKETEEKSGGAAEKIASAVAEAAEAAKTMVADTDDVQGHEEL